MLGRVFSMFRNTVHSCRFERVRRHCHPTVMQDCCIVCWACGKAKQFGFVCRSSNGRVYMSSNANNPERIPEGVAFELFGEFGEVTNTDPNVQSVLGRGFAALCKEVAAK
jgi:hypothetical protein